MSTKREHLNLIQSRGRFKVDCSHAIFSNDEILLLEKYGHWFMALENGELDPLTDLQKEFVLVSRGGKQPISFEECAWFKYKGRKRLEKENPDRLKAKYTPTDDSFYNRDMAKVHRRMVWSEIMDIHKK